MNDNLMIVTLMLAAVAAVMVAAICARFFWGGY